MPSKCFEDFRRGERWTAPFHRVTNEEIIAFARLSGDRNPLHLDAEYAKATPFKRPIAHGLLGLSLASGMLDRLGIVRKTVVAFIGLEWRFVAPIYPGDRVRLKLSVSRKSRTGRSDRGIVEFDAALVNHKSGKKEATVQEGRWKLLIRRRGGSSEGERER
ncbi:MAG TPA: MaoC/PaaZ C-terminal domain-containing protein [Nitrospiria bacterium]|nr:MaoC/PaaZ C-terminal domain-containing protein [Nitrospiria bacterium]